jgi:hypothetical protein
MFHRRGAEVSQSFAEGVVERQRESKEEISFRIFSAFPQRDLRAFAVSAIFRITRW